MSCDTQSPGHVHRLPSVSINARRHPLAMAWQKSAAAVEGRARRSHVGCTAFDGYRAMKQWQPRHCVQIDFSAVCPLARIESPASANGARRASLCSAAVVGKRRVERRPPGNGPGRLQRATAELRSCLVVS
jgi:hypothetical protein